MSRSDFCFVPLGQSDGDSDRYLPALLYGCVPVFTAATEAKPFDEVLNWKHVSLSLAGGARVPMLHKLLANISDARLLRMRRAMATTWPRLLWTSLHVGAAAHLTNEPSRADGVSYLGEPSETDAFETLIAVLRRRLGLLAHSEAAGAAHA